MGKTKMEEAQGRRPRGGADGEPRHSSARQLRLLWCSASAKTERGATEERAGGFGSFKSRPRSEGRSHDARRGRQLQQRRARAVPSCAGTRTALTGGAERSASAGKGAAAVAARPFGWAGPAAGRVGELGRGRTGLRGKERRPAGRISRREEKMILFFSFSTLFQIHF